MENWKKFATKRGEAEAKSRLMKGRDSAGGGSGSSSPFQISVSTGGDLNNRRESENRSSIITPIDEGEDFHIIEQQARESFDSDHSSLVIADQQDLMPNPRKSLKRLNHTSRKSVQPGGFRRGVLKEQMSPLNIKFGGSSERGLGRGGPHHSLKPGVEQATSAVSEAKLERLLNQMEAQFSKREAANMSLSSIEIKEAFDFCWRCLQEMNRVRMLSNPKYLTEKGMPQSTESMELRIFRRLKKIFALLLGQHIQSQEEAQEQNTALKHKNNELHSRLKEMSLEFFAMREEVAKQVKLAAFSSSDEPQKVSEKLSMLNELTKRLASVENEDLHKEVNRLKIQNERLEQRLNDVRAEIEKKASRARENYQQRKFFFKTSGAVEELRRLHQILTEKNEVLIYEDEDLLSEANPQNFNFALEQEMQRKLEEVQKETTSAVIRAFTQAKPSRNFGQSYTAQSLRDQAKQHAKEIERAKRDLARAKDKSDKLSEKIMRLENENTQIQADHQETKQDLGVLKRENQMHVKKSAALQLEIEKLNFALLAAENVRDKQKAKVMELLETLQESSKTAEMKALRISQLENEIDGLREDIEKQEEKMDRDHQGNLKRSLSTPKGRLFHFNSEQHSQLNVTVHKVPAFTQTEESSFLPKSQRDSNDFLIVTKLQQTDGSSRNQQRPQSHKEKGKKRTLRSTRSSKRSKRLESHGKIEPPEIPKQVGLERKLDVNIECKDILDNLGDSQEMSPVNMDPKGISDSKRELSHFSRPFSQEVRPKTKHISTSRHQYTQHGYHRGIRSSSYSQFSSALPSAKHMTSRYEPDILKYVTKPLSIENAQSVGVQVQLLKPRFIIRRNFGTGTITLSTAPGSANPSPARGERDFNFFNGRNQFSAPSLARVKSSELNQTTPVDWRGGFVPSKVLKAELEIQKHNSMGRGDFKVYSKHKKSRSSSSARSKPLPPVRNRNSGLPFIERQQAQSLLQKSFFPPPIIKAEVTRRTAHFTIESAPTQQNQGSRLDTSQNFSKIEEEPQFKFSNPINLDDREQVQITENSSSFSCSIPLQEREEHSPFGAPEEQKLSPNKAELSPIAKKSSRRITATNETPHPVTTLKVKRVVGEKAVNANPLDSLVVGKKCLQERREL